MSKVLSVEQVVELTFLRGLTMQRAVPRDADGRSSFGMVAASPIRVGPFFSQAALANVVQLIADRTQRLLQIVNYNVEGSQYVVTGDVANLMALGYV